MKVKALQRFAYSTDGINNFQVEKGQVVEDFPQSEYESCKTAGLIEDFKEAPETPAKSKKDEDKAAGDDGNAGDGDENGGDAGDGDEKKGGAVQDGSQDGGAESASSSQAGQAPETSPNKSGKSGKSGKSK